MITIKDPNSPAPKWDWTKIIFTLLGIAILLAVIYLFFVSKKGLKMQAADAGQSAGAGTQGSEMTGTTHLTPGAVPDVPIPDASAEPEPDIPVVTPEKAIEMV